VQKSIRRYTSKQKIDILRQHLIDQLSVTHLCGKYHISAGLLCQWLLQWFENGEAAFEARKRYSQAGRKCDAVGVGHIEPLPELMDERPITASFILAVRLGLTEREAEVL
jgi:transposase